jgi:hypothetical protein
MKRVLQSKVETLVARKLIAGDILPGPDHCGGRRKRRGFHRDRPNNRIQSCPFKDALSQQKS